MFVCLVFEECFYCQLVFPGSLCAMTYQMGTKGPLSWDPVKSLPTLWGKDVILLLNPVSLVEGIYHSIWLDDVSTSWGLPLHPLKVGMEHCSIGYPSLALLLGLSGDVCKKEVLVEQLVTLHSSSLASSRYPEQKEVPLDFPIWWPLPSVSWFSDPRSGAPGRGCVSPYPGTLSVVLELWSLSLEGLWSLGSPEVN